MNIRLFALCICFLFKPTYSFIFASNTTNANYLNIRNLGAVGDGFTDDTRAFELAFSKSTPLHIIVPKGTYLISRTLKPTKGKKIKFEQATLKASDKFVKGKAQEYALILINEKDVVIDGITIDGSNKRNLKLTGINASNNSDNLLVMNSKIQNCGANGFIVHANNTNNVQFINCHSINNLTGFGQEKWQFRKGEPKNIKYLNCVAKGCEYGLYIAGGTANIDGCYFQGSKRHVAFFYIGDAVADFTNVIIRNTTFDQKVDYTNISIVGTEKIKKGNESYSDLTVSFMNCIFKNPINVNRIIEAESPVNIVIDKCSFNGGAGQIWIKKNPIMRFQKKMGDIRINDCDFIDSSSYGISTSTPIKLSNSVFKSSIGNKHMYALNLQDYAHGSVIDNVTFGSDMNNTINIGIRKQKSISNIKLNRLKAIGNTKAVNNY